MRFIIIASVDQGAKPVIIWIIVTLKPCPKLEVASSVGPIVEELNTREAVLCLARQIYIGLKPKLYSDIYFRNSSIPITCAIRISVTLQERSMDSPIVSHPSAPFV